MFFDSAGSPVDRSGSPQHSCWGFVLSAWAQLENCLHDNHAIHIFEFYGGLLLKGLANKNIHRQWQPQTVDGHSATLWPFVVSTILVWTSAVGIWPSVSLFVVSTILAWTLPCAGPRPHGPGRMRPGPGSSLWAAERAIKCHISYFVNPRAIN